MERRTVTIYLPKNFSYRKLKNHIQQQVANKNLWRLEVIPLENCNLVHIFCLTNEVFDKLTQLNFVTLPKTIKSASRETGDPLTHSRGANEISLLDLPVDCLHHILTRCRLKEQIILAKVSKQLYRMISDIWRVKYKTLHYDYFDLEFREHIGNEELRDFCFVAANNVSKIRFSSIFYLALIQNHLCFMPGNLMQNAKNFINSKLCRNLMYFENLMVFEVQGKFLLDFTVYRLAKYCPKVKVLRLLDAGSRWFTGKYLDLLPNLEVLELKDCINLQRRHLLRASVGKKLKNLNIVECKELESTPFFLKLCNNLENLNTLRLSAFSADTILLKTILNLSHLKCLQFYWLNEGIRGFQQTFIGQLGSSTKCTELQRLKFENERSFVENESLENLSETDYALLREQVSIKSRPWHWDEDEFEDFAENLKNFNNLKEITFMYCRLLDNEDLLTLPRKCKNLKLLRMVGCRSKADDYLSKQWQSEEATKDCTLSIEGLLTATRVSQMRQVVAAMRFSTNNAVLRSIECRFD